MEDEDRVSEFAEENGMVWVVVVDGDGGVADSYHVEAIPSLVLIDRSGIVRSVHVGADRGVRAEGRDRGVARACAGYCTADNL